MACESNCLFNTTHGAGSQVEQVLFTKINEIIF